MCEIKIDGATLECEVATNSSTAKQYVSIVGARDVHGHIKIPEEIEGVPVKCIGGCAFCGCKGLTGVTIPDGIGWIGESAFTAAANLNYVKIPTSVRGIAECAFSCCGRLWSVEIPEGVMWVGFSAFVMCYSLVRVTIPSTLESIPRWMFSDCCSLLSVKISPGVRSIEGCAFSGCRALRRVMIPESMTNVGKYAFSGCRNLASVSAPRHLKNESLKSAFEFCSPELKIAYREGENAETTDVAIH